MINDQTLQAVGQALQNKSAIDFVRTSIKAGYYEFFPAAVKQVDVIVDLAFDRLAKSQHDLDVTSRLMAVTADLAAHTFRKDDPSFWFNDIYHRYKTQIKPEADFQQLRDLIIGSRILDYGCGSGYLAARLARGGYDVSTTDVLDYRYAEAQPLPFRSMSSPTDIPYPDDSIDTALVQAVFHHIGPDDLPLVLRHLARIAQHALIKEDTYDLPAQLPGVAETKAKQPLLHAFMEMPRDTQCCVLILIDFYANAIAQGILEMNMPFEFRSVTQWQETLEANGWKVNRTWVAGFEPGRMHKSCHVWFVCERLR